MTGAALRLVLVLFSILMFVLALILMKEGAKPLAPVIRQRFMVTARPARSASAGFLPTWPYQAHQWLLRPWRYWMRVSCRRSRLCNGCRLRLGAAFIVLLVGFVYVLRGKQRDLSLSVGLLSLLVTRTMYPVVLALGFFLLSSGWLQRWQVQAAQDVSSPFEVLFNPMLAFLQQRLPAWILFWRFLLILFSLWLFDKVLPESIYKRLAWVWWQTCYTGR
jgi:hypothetical protein